jgi:hypothetical protein
MNIFERKVYRRILGPVYDSKKENSGAKGLRWLFRKLEGVVGTGWSWLRIGTGGGHL